MIFKQINTKHAQIADSVMIIILILNIVKFVHFTNFLILRACCLSNEKRNVHNISEKHINVGESS
jgi:hypothetical protein